jgi:hypothetical protein
VLTFVCWKWKPNPGYRSVFGPGTVNTLYSMLARHYSRKFELVCVTDDQAGIRSEVRCIELWKDFANVPSPHGRMYPSCYRRLRMFSADAASHFGDRFVSIDLDVVICRDITDLFDTEIEFRMYGDTAKGTPYNGSLIQLKAGARLQVWDKFDPRYSPQHGLAKRYIGSDQAWIAVCLGPKEAKFTAADGVFSYRNEIAPRGGALPSAAKIVIMHGHVDPWTPMMQAKHAWIREHYK